MRKIRNILLIIGLTCAATTLAKQIKPIKPELVEKTHYNKQFPFRKNMIAKNMIARLACPIIDLCLTHKVPPAAIIAMMGVESGWGYAANATITGNYLGTNTLSKEYRLPAVTFHKHITTGKYIFSKADLLKYHPKEITTIKKPASLKKDYRPEKIRGTNKDLGYFQKNPTELTEANIHNAKDFVFKSISENSSIKSYKEARLLLDKAVDKYGEKILFDKKFNIKFLQTIGGRPSSFNTHKRWPGDITRTLIQTGLVELCYEMQYGNKEFEESW